MNRTTVGKQGGTTGNKRLARDIKRQASDHTTRRFLRTLPPFQVVSDLPEHLRNLLDELESLETTVGDRE